MTLTTSWTASVLYREAVMTGDESRLRIDRWLWAARFFRTRSLAKAAIEGGKVHCAGQRVKVSKAVHVGMCLTIRQGDDERDIEILALSAERGAATQAQTLYQESAASLARRAQRRLQGRQEAPAHRPDKRARRHILRFLQP